MAHVFVSYKAEDRSRARLLVEGLRRAGLAVWWDQDIPQGAAWEEAITEALAAAGCVIVCWSKKSVDPALGAKVQVEAREALNKGALLQALIDPVLPPLFFRQWQAADLSDWDGKGTHAKFQALTQAARDVLDGRAVTDLGGLRKRRRAPWAWAAAGVAALSAGLGLIANLGGARDAVCSLPAAEAGCRALGLLAPPTPPPASAPTPTPAEAAAAARAQLLASLEGRWVRVQGGDCAAALTLRVVRGADGVDLIVLTDERGESRGQVVAAENGAIVSRAVTPSAAGVLETWTYRPAGAFLTAEDPSGLGTELRRCP